MLPQPLMKMTMRRSMVLVALVLLALFCSHVHAASAGVEFGTISNPTKRLLELVNQERTSRGLAPLCASRKLIQAAQAHSQDQLGMNRMSHTGSDGSSPADRIDRVGFNWNRIAENVARGQDTEDEVHQDWMNSPGHRANILGNYVFFGAGFAGGFWTEDFGSGSGELCLVDAASGNSSSSVTSLFSTAAVTTSTSTSTSTSTRFSTNFVTVTRSTPTSTATSTSTFFSTSTAVVTVSSVVPSSSSSSSLGRASTSTFVVTVGPASTSAAPSLISSSTLSRPILTTTSTSTSTSTALTTIIVTAQPSTASSASSRSSSSPASVSSAPSTTLTSLVEVGSSTTSRSSTLTSSIILSSAPGAIRYKYYNYYD